MSTIETKKPVIANPSVDKKTKKKLLAHADEQSTVVVHCRFNPGNSDSMVRIWRSTYLNANNSNHRSKLLHAENITLYPVWTPVDGGRIFNFTLIFSGLPKSCTAFDLHEDIPQEGGFFVVGIARNATDVYVVDISE